MTETTASPCGAHRGRILLFRCILCLCLLLGLEACEIDAFTVQEDNDVLSPIHLTDRDYTQGLRLEWLLSEDATRSAFSGVLEHLPLFPAIELPAATVELGQEMYTPLDLGARQVIPDDRPYAGYLYGGLLLQNVQLGSLQERNDRRDAWELQLGVIGPDSQAERAQRVSHALFRDSLPNGWGNQLPDEPALLLRYQRSYRVLYGSATWPFQTSYDLLATGTLSLGNVETSAQLGGLLRFGGLPRDFGPQSVSPRLRDQDGPVLPLYGFLGASGRAVGYTAFLDGDLLRDSHHVRKEALTADFTGGIALPFDVVTISLTLVVRTPEFEERSRWHNWTQLRFTFWF